MKRTSQHFDGALGRPLGGEQDPIGTQMGRTRLRRAGPRTQEARLPSRRRGNTLVRWMAVLELEEVIVQRLKG
jgi:hypothetical protein